MDILIDVVRISNFRSLKNIEIRLNPLTLLVGSNNSGKTTFLKAINLALGTERKYISKDDFYISKTDDPKANKQIRIDIRIVPVDSNYSRVKEFSDLWRDVEFGELISLDANDNQYVSFRTEVSFNSAKNDFEIRKFKVDSWNEDSTDWEKRDYPDPLKSSFQSIPLFFIDAQRDILGDLKDRSSYLGKLISKIEIAPEKIKELEDKIKSINDEIIGNSQVLTHLKDQLKELSNTIKSGSAGIEITPINNKIREINKGLNINFQDGDNESFPLEYHGMGTRSWASILTFKAYITWLVDNLKKDGTIPFYPILALEEPEAHLHPNAQRHLYSQLSNINGQKIISTHSPFITGQCALENLRHFYKGAENPQVSQLNLQGTSPEDIRKLRREIMHSRGELLYSKTIVLFEGETEEQALPIFAKAFWNKYPFELGINFVGVGGSGKYLPFIRFCIAFKIPWFILSDGEASAIRDITSALNSVGKKMEECTENLTIIPNGSDFEKHLLETGYQEEVKNSKISILEGILKSEDFKSPQEKEAKEKKFEDDKNKIATLTDADLENFMDKNKTAFSPVISEIIVKLSDKKRRFPPIVKELLDKIANKIGVEIHKDNL